MKPVTSTYRVSINLRPEAVFEYVSDLTKHSEWNEGLRIEALTPGAIGVGSRYRSVGKALNQDHPNDLRVTIFEPPTVFAFVADNPGFGDVTNEFKISPQKDGSLVERSVTFHMTPLAELAWKLVLYPFFNRPENNRSLAALKAKMESTQPQSTPGGSTG